MNCIKNIEIAEDFNRSEKLFENISSNTVTVFGSARTKPSSLHFKEAELLAHKLANADFNIVSGGGNGIMKAANKGAFLSNNDSSKSIGLSIELPFEVSVNEFVDDSYTFNYFFSRKYMLVKHSKAAVVFPGGFGTLDELFEVLTLVQTNSIQEGFKIFLYDSSYWNPLMNFIKESLLSYGMISEKDISLLHVSDDINNIFNNICLLKD